jgi:hypothetical protein
MMRKIVRTRHEARRYAAKEQSALAAKAAASGG